MKEEELKQALFDPTMRLFAVLDAGTFRNLPMRLHESGLESYCLIEGQLEPDVLYQAPYLVRLLPKHDFTDWLLKDFLGKNKGIFAHSRATLIEMRQHFTALFKVHDETGKPMLFRYYDPRVFRKFLPTCTVEELETLYGDVVRFFVEEDEQVENLFRYELAEDGLKTTNMNGEGE